MMGGLTSSNASGRARARRIFGAAAASALALPILAAALSGVPAGAAPSNLAGTIYQSNGPAAVNSQVTACQQGNPNCVGMASTTTGGYALTLLSGTWNVTANPPASDSSDAPTSVTVTVNTSGVVTKCTGTGCGGTLPTVDIHLQKANVAGIVHESDGTAATNTQVFANPQVGGTGTFTNTNTAGHYGLLLSSGTWNVTANPPTDDTVDASTLVTVTVNTSGVVTKCTGAGCGGTLPTVDIHLQKITLAGIVYKSNGTPAANAQVSANPQVGGSGTGTNTNTTGHYVLALGPGTWNVTANPPMGDTVDAMTSVTVTVNTSGVVTKCTGAGCGGTLPTVDIHLQRPNVAGIVYKANGTPSAYSQIGANPQFGGNGTGTNTNTAGHYGLILSAGTWNVTANPPSGDTVDAMTTVTVTVNSSGVVTNCTGAGCGGTLPTVDIHLQKANVAGTVFKSNGTPAANTQVFANPQFGGNGTSTFSDMTGHYGLSLSPGTWNVTATPPTGDTVDAGTTVTVTVGAGGVVTKCTGAGCGGTLPTVDIHLQKANVAGTVFKSNGTPAANTQVFANPQFGGGNTGSNTNTAGHYGLSLSPGTWNLSVSPPMGDTVDATTWVTVTVNTGGVVSKCTGAGCGGTLPTVDIHLQKANVTGTVFKSNGTPATNTQVSASPQFGGTGTGTMTNTVGHYGLFLSHGTWNVTANPPMGDTVDATMSVTVTVNTSGVVTKCTGVGCGGTLPTVDIHLQMANVAGTVFMSNGTPAANAQLFASPQFGGAGTGTSSNMAGHYGLYLSPGTWNLTANPPFSDTADTATSVTVTVNTSGVVSKCTGAGCGGTLPTVNIHLQKGNVSGTVHQSNGSTAANASISACPTSTGGCVGTFTDASGDYHLGLAHGTWKITVSAPTGDTVDGSTSVLVTVNTSGVVTACTGAGCTGTPPPVNIKLQVANVSGTVRASNGTPATGTGVFACEQATMNQCVSVNTDMSGHYALVLTPGTWTLSVGPPSGDTTDAITSVTVMVNTSGVVTTCTGAGCTGTPPPVNIKLQVANVSGTVHESTGTTATSANVSACPQGQTDCLTTMTDSSGSYRLALSSGTWTIRVSPPNGDTVDSTTTVAVTVNSGGVATKCTGAGCTGSPPPVNIKLQVPSISGMVTAGTSPLAGVCVGVYPVGSTNFVAYAVTGVGGTYSVPSLKPGAYDVDFLSTGYGGFCHAGNYPTQWWKNKTSKWNATAVTVTAGKTTPTIDATVVLGGTISGTVTSAATKTPISNICVGVTGMFHGTLVYVNAFTKSTGTYSIAGLPAGSYKVSFTVGRLCAGPKSGNYATQWYSGVATESVAGTVTVTSGHTTTTINAAMLAGGTIKGTVTTKALGLGLQRGCIEAVPVGGSQPVNFTTTNAPDGSYVLTGLAAGSYKIEFQTADPFKPGNCGPSKFVTQWYDGKFTQTTAQVITVTNGSTHSGVDAVMLPSIPPPPATTTSHSSGTSYTQTTVAKATTTTSGVVATATGVGAITVAKYATNPTSTSLATGTGQFFDVKVSTSHSFASLAITDCDLSGGDALYWWTGTAYKPVSPPAAAGPTAGCLTFTATATSTPSLTALSGTILAVATAVAPAKPTAPHATRGNAQATVTWTAPTTGGRTITKYTVISTPTGKTCTTTGTLTCTVRGLKNGTAYTFTVKAHNAVGTSAASTPSTAVTPSTVPSKPAKPTATAGNAKVTVAWTAPTSGGSPIT
ncbi:MAG: beta strand repeat-containing protein, partial [Acidimicrobiales bacterium]